jgi:hypothetical protein
MADNVLTDFLEQCDEQFEYRYRAANPAHLFASALVVEFSEDFVERATTFNAIQQTINEGLGSPEPPYKLKRIAFGYDSSNEVGINLSIPMTVSRALPTDFAIERRAEEPMGRNRFFCLAPLRTSDHIALLEKIECEATR